MLFFPVDLYLYAHRLAICIVRPFHLEQVNFKLPAACFIQCTFHSIAPLSLRHSWGFTEGIDTNSLPYYALDDNVLITQVFCCNF